MLRVYAPPCRPVARPSRERPASHRFACVLAALLSLLVTSCTPADWAAVEAVGQVAKAGACMICNAGAPAVEDAMAAHAEALRAMTEALAKAADRKADPAEVAAIRRELQASQERERALATRLLLLAIQPASAAPVPSVSPP